MDTDLLGRIPNDPAVVRSVFESVCAQDVPPDGMAFAGETIVVEGIAAEAAYAGARGSLRGRLGNARVLIRVDIGFGDRVVPEPEPLDLPALLDFPAPRLRAYCRETAIAEKFHAMVQLGELNSRMKDFFDIWTLSRGFCFDGQVQAKAIEATFGGRMQPVPSRPLALTGEFARSASKQVQWASFLRKRRVCAPADFTEVMAQVVSFLQPIAEALAAGRPFQGEWTAPGPWTSPTDPETMHS